jgi:UDP-N-acetylglucosamine 2-epimerase
VQQSISGQGSGPAIALDKDFIVVLQHPETDCHEQSHAHMALTLGAVAQTGLPALVFWPNIDAGADGAAQAIRTFRDSGNSASIRIVQNLEGHLFLRLLQQCACLIGNSSVGIRESAFLGTPVVNIGRRQSGRERASNVVDCGWDARQISAALRQQLGRGRYPSSTIYGNGFAGSEIARVVGELACSL